MFDACLQSMALFPCNFVQCAVSRRPEEAGLWYEVLVIRERLSLRQEPGPAVGPHYKPGLDNSFANNESDDTETLEFDVDDENYETYLESLDPTQWKEQDHYKVLGLSQLRWRASDDHLRSAYRQKVVKHHPDKRRHYGKPVKSGEEDYFTCIVKAYETLNSTQKRRAYDSVDPDFDDSIPPSIWKSNSESSFFNTFGKVFERNSRWSRIQPVPQLGDLNEDFDHCDGFYTFWYNFDSWREFSYLDEEDKEKGENREERRYIDRENKATRDKRRKDEVKRIRTLVNLAYSNDPRIIRFKDEEKRKKEEEKLQRQQERLSKKAEEEAKKKAAEDKARKEKEAAEEQERQKVIAEKKGREARKKALQKERKQLDSFISERQFFTADEQEKLKRMAELDKLSRLLSLDQLRDLNDRLLTAHEDESQRIFEDEVKALEDHLQAEKDELLQKVMRTSKKGNEEIISNGTSSGMWSNEESQLLVKAMTLFPVGTKSRWDVIAAFINEHNKNQNGRQKTGKDVVNRVKELQSSESIAKTVAPVLATSKKGVTTVNAEPSSRNETPAELNNCVPWTVEEQKLFEQALKTYSTSTADRWDRIAECLPGRSKKDCIKRYKELAELVQSKKMAQEALKKKT